MMKLKMTMTAFLMIALAAMTFAPSASAATEAVQPPERSAEEINAQLAGGCTGIVPLALCVVDGTYCTAWYVVFGNEPPGCSNSGTNTGISPLLHDST